MKTWMDEQMDAVLDVKKTQKNTLMVQSFFFFTFYNVLVPAGKLLPCI